MKAELSGLYVSFPVACFGVIASQVEFHDLIIITKSSFHLMTEYSLIFAVYVCIFHGIVFSVSTLHFSL